MESEKCAYPLKGKHTEGRSGGVWGDLGGPLEK
jgi:hypothetical protein